jgi:hypothetical protein
VTNSEYLDILRIITMEKVIVEEIKRGNRKDKENKQTKQVAELGSAT